MNETLINLIQLAANLFSFLVLARVIMSWFTPDPSNPLVGLVYRFTEPVLAPVRNFLPALGGMDFSPILILFGVQIAERVLINLVLRMT